MRGEATIIYPDQLFWNHPGLAEGRPVYLFEDPLFFADPKRRLRFHNKKLVLHLASIQAYQEALESRAFRVGRIPLAPGPGQEDPFPALGQKGIRTVYLAEPADIRLEKRVRAQAKKQGIRIVTLDSPGFLTPKDWIAEFFIGWREFMRAVYLLEEEKLRTTNFWDHNRRLPASLYSGETGLEPLDTVVRRIVMNAYAHHIERLMVLGNFMLLAEIAPDEVYRWFMEMFIDAYDWVMVPNVYGMSQYADGGMLTTKPYISSSNYLRKMSDFPAGDWCPVWDGLFWRFIGKHHGFFSRNSRLIVMARQFDRMNAARKLAHLRAADAFLDSL